ncbi:LysR family transcriptional regulator [Paraburkholderia hospita]|uniref:LysR family transcriptional regulator n=1 Tax=Paraburkholderia hospita TaxID=169430 RepID=UPI000271AD6B|nr:LysR family transcriptional regulator [Paraburkholderia hospita]EUC18786.1 transcriptional regulator, LysR family [Burkholderia sp. BT03]SKC61024.1 transcriptional regulator, LysR family [Paraburkholderia hospita]
MNLLTLDLNLLLVFDSILRTKSTTLAAEELSLTQSAVSNALKRLRTSFDDPLFTKTKDGMLPTSLAEGLAGHVSAGLASFRQAVETKTSFNPQTSDRSFTIYMSDLGQMVFMPKLISHIASVAPNIRIITVDATPKDAQNAMSTGEIDLALGLFMSFDPGFHQQRLFREHYVAVVRDGHPGISTSLSLRRFLDARHAVYKPTAGSHAIFEEAVEGVFEENGRVRQVPVRLAHSLGLSQMIATSDLLVCVPSRLANAFNDYASVRVFPLPFEAPTFDISQLWHDRCHRDAGHRWLRSTVASLFVSLHGQQSAGQN